MPTNTQQHNNRVVLTAPFAGMPRPEDFKIISEPMPDPDNGEMLIRHIYLSLDPYQRSTIAGRHGAAGPLGEGEMPNGEVVGQVIRSRHSDFADGEYVRHFGGWQEYSLSDGMQTFALDPDQAPLSTYVGVLGMPGLTAYASMIELADVQAGQTVLVSAAHGPVGSMVGQIAIQKGARAIGIAGSDEKCRLVVDELGFGACINYKDEYYPGSLEDALPDGADIYHDNVGGDMLADALSVLKNYGTVILCGLISQYNDPSQAVGLNLASVILKRAVLKGLVVYDFEDRRQEFLDMMVPWVRDGTIKYLEDRVDGLEHAGSQFTRLMSGQNVGKALVVIGPESL
jgi:NADPH-dependent curcumin reductase CurA